MNRLPLILLSLVSAAPLPGASKPETNPPPAPVILDEAGVKNLRIQTAKAETTDFETTVFALGRIEVRPGNVASVSSPIPGRVAALAVLPGDSVKAGDGVLRVESRQPGSPPPVINLTSPISGEIVASQVHLGDPVEPERALLEIVNLDEVVAVARIPEHAVGRIPPQAHARITFPSHRGLTMEGRLARFSAIADAGAGVLDAHFILPNPDRRLRPGLRAEFAIITSQRRDVLSIPRSALQGDAASRFVFVRDIKLANAFIKTSVVTGETNDRFVEIISGLRPADDVVVQGGYALMFAGSGTLSLKDALDAAHGHEHAADGSELNGGGGAQAVAGGTREDSHDHDHEHGHDHADGHDHDETALEWMREHVWMLVSGVLFLSLVAVLSFRGGRRDDLNGGNRAGVSENHPGPHS